MFATLLSTYLLLFAIPAEIVVVSLPARDDVEFPMTPAGTVDISHSGSFSRVRVEIDRIQPATSLGPSANTYVAWAISPEGAFDNLGEVTINGNRGRLDSMTVFDQLGVIVTAEPHYLVDRPSSTIVYKGAEPRSASVRRQTISVDVGTYDYTGLLSTTAPTIPNIASQARSAYQIAIRAEANRWAEADLRLARVALDTMEELINRAAPIDLMLPSAHETIRRSQRALTLARENQEAAALAEVRGTVTALEQDIQANHARIQQLTTEQAAAAERIRKLEADLGNAGRERQQLQAEKDAVDARLRTSERDAAELRRMNEESRNALDLRLLPDYFDMTARTLTPAGREALTKIFAAAVLWSEPVRLGVPQGTTEIVTAFIGESGVPPERIVIIPF